MLKLTPGQAHDGRSAEGMFASIGAGDVRWQIVPMMPTRCAMNWRDAVPGQISSQYRTSKMRRPSAHSFIGIAISSSIFFNRLKHFRAVATRYGKRDDNFLASVQLASIRIWLRHNKSVT